MQKYDISIVIPLYNTPEKYFRRCLRSIYSSAGEVNVEVIVVDDGSKDENGAVYREIVKEYNTVQYFRQRNSGVSVARNKGIALATGQYIVFVDGDDEVNQNFLAHAYKFARQYEADIIVGQIEYIPSINKERFQSEFVYLQDNDMVNLKKALLGVKQEKIPFRVTGSPCARLYKGTVIKSIEFPPGVTHWEDQIFNRRVFDACSSAVVSGENWYKYYQNDFSAMHTKFDVNYIKNAIPFWNIWNEMNKMEDDLKICRGIKKNSLNYYYSAIHQSILNMPVGWKQKRKTMLLLKSEAIFVELIKESSYADMQSVGDKVRLFLLKNNLFAEIYLAVWIKKRLGK